MRSIIRSRRPLRAIPLAIAVTVSVSVGASIGASVGAAPDQPDGETVNLPITRAVLFSSGVGYFEHSGTVSGDAVMRLAFKTDQINDVLKSMVLFDLDGGTVRSVSYGANDPLDRALRSFGVDLSGNPTLPELLHQLRGAEVELSAPDRIRGRILNVEERQKAVPGSDAIVTEPVLNLVTNAGIRTVPLASMESIQFADATLQEELNRALLMLVSARDTEQKPVDIQFSGRGERRVRIGYLVETPVWKTSYRLDLSDQTPWLQGWAIVENTSNNDWEGVGLALVSGRPISFIQDLYTPLYVPRPVVVPELYASLRPQTYERGMSAKATGDDVALEERRRREGIAAAPASSAMAGGATGGGGGLFGSPSADRLHYSFADSGVSAAAEGARLGELFQYQVSHPVDLSRRRSAMLPIVNEGVKAERVSIYNASVLAKHPLNGVWMTNSTSLKLLAGPVTVFDGGSYAGDAQVDHLAPGEKRLLSYAVDLEVHVDSSSRSTTRIVSGRIVDGVLMISRRAQYDQTYAIENLSDRGRTLIVEHPVRSDRKLLQPEQYEEKTPTAYRFRVEVAAGRKTEFLVREQQTYSQQIVILDQPINAIEVYVANNEIDPKVREALARAIRLKQELSALERQRSEREGEVRQITQGQDRLRQNIQTVGADSPLGKRYLAKMAEEEDRLEALEKEMANLRGRIEATRQELMEYLNSLRIG